MEVFRIKKHGTCYTGGYTCLMDEVFLNKKRAEQYKREKYPDDRAEPSAYHVINQEVTE